MRAISALIERLFNNFPSRGRQPCIHYHQHFKNFPPAGTSPLHLFHPLSESNKYTILSASIGAIGVFFRINKYYDYQSFSGSMLEHPRAFADICELG